MKKSLLLLTLSVCLVTANSIAAIFSDDFESGLLDQWTIGGRQAGREGFAEIVNYNGSQMAYIYQDGFTETKISNYFDYQENLTFSFDMYTQLNSEAAEADSPFYAWGGVMFFFFDNIQQEIGRVAYRASTSTYIDDLWGSENPQNKLVLLPENSGSYVYDMPDILSQITIEENNIDQVEFAFLSYTSGSIYNMHAHTWVDNVVVTPEPMTVLLLGLGGLFLRKKRS